MSEIGNKYKLSFGNRAQNETVEVTVVEEREVLDFYVGVLDDKPGLRAVDNDGNEYYKNWYAPRVGVDENSWTGKKTKLNKYGVWYDIKGDN